MIVIHRRFRIPGVNRKYVESLLTRELAEGLFIAAIMRLCVCTTPSETVQGWVVYKHFS